MIKFKGSINLVKVYTLHCTESWCELRTVIMGPAYVVIIIIIRKYMRIKSDKRTNYTHFFFAFENKKKKKRYKL